MTENDFNLGIEVEWPRTKGEKYKYRGLPSNDLRRHVDPSVVRRGRPVYDGTVGLEVVSNTISAEDAPGWYADVIHSIENEYGEQYEPVGLMDGGNTAGTHIHISPLSAEKARRLAELSQEPWMHVFACSSIAVDDDNSITWPVFRGGTYCELQYADHHEHYYVVNRRGNDHFEWRLPEPMVPEHMELMVEFLDRFIDSEERAIQFVQELLDSGDERITAIRRAEHVGMDIDEMPTFRRDGVPEQRIPPESVEFFNDVREKPHYPEIFYARYGGEQYFVLRSELEASGITHDILGAELPLNTALHADTLEPVADDELQRQIIDALSRRNGQRRETEATQALKDIVKKKK